MQAQEVERAGRGVFGELCELLSEATGVLFAPTITASYRELATSLERREIGIAWMPPIPTIERQQPSAMALLETLPQQSPISTAPELPPPKKLAAADVPTGPTPACPQCESPMAWVEEHLRFYCRDCRMYF